MDDFPSVVQDCGKCAEAPTAVNETVKKPILVTGDIEKIAMIAKLVDLLRGGKWRAWTIVSKPIEIRE